MMDNDDFYCRGTNKVVHSKSGEDVENSQQERKNLARRRYDKLMKEKRLKNLRDDKLAC